MTRTLIIGDSHAIVLKAGSAWLSMPRLEPLLIGAVATANDLMKPFFEARDGVIEFTDAEVRRRVEALMGTPSLDPRELEWVGLSMGMHDTFFHRDEMWTRMAPVALAGGDRRRLPVSQAAFAAMVEAFVEWPIRFARTLADGGAKVFVIGAPPPHRTHPGMQDPDDRVVRLAVSEKYRTLAARAFSAAGISVVQTPATAYDPDGFLRSDLMPARTEDLHHGNAKFGVYMLREIDRFMLIQERVEASRREQARLRAAAAPEEDRPEALRSVS
ncbi:hypothetical protein [Propylenella binzhouense]|uniref:Uncharacterized protein n=1 Tax=Propylenella binzhouense TaxID=2555902 RepID=A0A964T840_9HYPH|nr:hypothetical protein [Propylenella binzhouense]MYZ50199.1 hypothetical protein [Propylenella binzhouense]